MTRWTAMALGASLLVLASGEARAQYGSLAYDSNTKQWGRSFNLQSPRDADQVALSFCRTGGCQVVVRTGPGQCGAIAAARAGTRYHWSTRPYRREAEYNAVAGC